MYFKWTEELNTGIADIDEQHRRIADYINALHTAEQLGDRREVGGVIEGLLGYTINHFSFEEQLLERSGYDYLRAHARVHELFGKRVAEYRGRFESGEDVTAELLVTLKVWLEKHIKEEDRAYLSTVMPMINVESSRGWLSSLVRKIFG